MIWFMKPDVVVKCYDAEEVGKLLHWMRLQRGLEGLRATRFTVVAVLGSTFGSYAKTVSYFEVHVPHGMYARLRDKFLEESAFNEVTLQEHVMKQITES